MLENFNVAATAVVPFIVYVLLGTISKKRGIVTEEYLKKLNGIVFKVFFPFIMFANLYDVDFSTLNGGTYVLITVIATTILLALLLIFVPIFEKENSRRGVIIQAILRSNSVLYAIPLVESVFGDIGALKASILVAFIVPFYNICCVAILEYYRGGRVKPFEIIKNILKNPIIVGAIFGMLFNILPITMPHAFVKPIDQLSAMATPLSLFVLGGTLHVSSMRKNAKVLAIGTVLKLIIIPGIMMYVMYLLNIRNEELFAAISAFATPVAVSSYAMAQSMGGDGDLAGEFVAVTTICSIGTIFVWIVVLKTIGMI